MKRRNVIGFLVALACHSVQAASLRGSPGALEKQNEEADKADLTRIQDDAQLERAKKQRLLVPIPEVKGVRIDSRLNEKWRFVRPWTADFIRDIARDFYKEFGREFQINSATRTVDSQRLLRLFNRNAAPTNGSRQTSHTTGATIDITKLTLYDAELVWFRKRLYELEKKGLIEATEEHVQPVFHIMVFKKYRSSRRKPARG